MNRRGRRPAEVVIPLRWDDGDDGAHGRRVAEMAAYLTRLVQVVDVTVVDGSHPRRAEQHGAAWPPGVRTLPPDPVRHEGPVNGKVVGAMSGVRAARHELVVLADDDVRYDEESLDAVLAELKDADLVRPQNVWTHWPWHARWDFARSCLARVTGHDWPGTFGLRRSTVLGLGGWSHEVLFENLELVRTVRAGGGRVVDADHVPVGRVPPSTRHFLSQRPRQAYDEWARPAHMLAAAAVLPALLAAASRRPGTVPAAACAVVVLAELGRRRPGTGHVPRDVPLWAPLWVLERGVCAWVAVWQRARGGVPYGGVRLQRAASTPRRPRGRSRAPARSRAGRPGPERAARLG